MLNYITGAILFMAKKSTMMTIVNVVDAILVLGLVACWAKNVDEVAIAWLIGDIGNTVLFGAFAFLAIREVGGRWDLLGASKVPVDHAVPAVPAPGSADTHQQALELLFMLAERQRTERVTGRGDQGVG